MAPTTVPIDASINVLWQNLIALNASLANENEEKSKQLIELKNILQEEMDKAKVLRTNTVELEKELLNKNRKIIHLTSKLEMVKQLTMDLCNDDSDDETTSIIEKDQKPQHKSVSTKPSSDQTSSSNQRKISNFFPTAFQSEIKLEFATQEFNNTEATSTVGKNSNSYFTDNRQYIEDGNLLVPLQSSPNQSPVKKVCNKCGRKFTSITSLKRHEFLHLELRPFVCSECKLRFKRSDHLKNHVKRVHGNNDSPNAVSTNAVSANAGNTMFPCTMCSKTFKHIRSLIFHKKKHHKKKSGKQNGFPCDECEAKFSYNYNLSRHKRNIHKRK